MRLRFDAPHFSSLTKGCEEDIAHAAVATMDEVTAGLKSELRDQVVAGGLGQRLANTWRGRRYPQTHLSINAVAYVWSRAPAIVDGFDRGATIVPINGRRYLAIPTDNVPARRRGGGFGSRGSKMSPFEVETTFNADLKFAKAGNGRLIAFIEATPSKSARGFRPATAGRLKQGRSAVDVVMFVLVPSVKLPKRLDIDGPADRWAQRVPGVLTQNMR